MKIRGLIKGGFSYIIVTLLVLFAAYYVVALNNDPAIALAITNSSQDQTILMDGANISGGVTIFINITDIAFIGNVSNITINYSSDGGLTNNTLHFNDTQNLTEYSFFWNTGNGTFPDNITYVITAVVTNTTTEGIDGDADRIIHVEGIIVDNTPPSFTMTTPGLGSTVFINDTALDFLTVTFTPIDLQREITDCNVTLDGTNSTFGADLNSTSGNGLNGTSVSLFVNAANVSEGSHTMVVSCIEDGGSIAFNTFQTGNVSAFTYIMDLTNPTVNLSFSDADVSGAAAATSFGSTTRVKIKCERFDEVAGINETKVLIQRPGDSGLNQLVLDQSLVAAGTTHQPFDYTLEASDTEDLGNYLVMCQVHDRAGNIQWGVNSTFEIVQRIQSTTSPFATEGFSAPVGKKKINTGYTADGGKLTEAGVSRLIAKGGVLKVNVKGVDHEVEVTTLSEESVTLTISSEPQTVTINAGETVEIDLDGDDTNDLAVTFHKQFPPGGKYADLSFAVTATPSTAPPTGKEAPPGGEEQQPPAPAGKRSNAGLIVTIIVIIVIIIIGYFMLSKKRK